MDDAGIRAVQQIVSDLEWSGTDEHVHGCCPICLNYPAEGHEGDCSLRKLVALSTALRTVQEGMPETDPPWTQERMDAYSKIANMPVVCKSIEFGGQNDVGYPTNTWVPSGTSDVGTLSADFVRHVGRSSVVEQPENILVHNLARATGPQSKG